MPRVLWVSTGALASLAAVIGFVAGRNWQKLDESAVINRAAARYVQETGKPATDCIARPGDGAVWINVTCGALIYQMDRRGRFLARALPDA